MEALGHRGCDGMCNYDGFHHTVLHGGTDQSLYALASSVREDLFPHALASSMASDFLTFTDGYDRCKMVIQCIRLPP